MPWWVQADMWAPMEPDGAFVRTLDPVHGAFARLIQALTDVIPRVLVAALVLLAFWVIAALLRRATHALCRLILRDRTLENLATQVTYYTTLAMGLGVAIEILGFSVQALVAGLGLTGLALGIALKDVISNFISGPLLFWLRPFGIGDQIGAGETEGTVERIEMRATQIRTYDGCLALVPNTQMLSSRIINRTAQQTRRGRVRLYLDYDAPLEHAVEAILDTTLRTKGVIRQPTPTVRVAELGPQAVSIWRCEAWSQALGSVFNLDRIPDDREPCNAGIMACYHDASMYMHAPIATADALQALASGKFRAAAAFLFRRSVAQSLLSVVEQAPQIWRMSRRNPAAYRRRGQVRARKGRTI